ncbi:purine nucleoside phosphorylase DeoD-type [Lysinibacillus sp. BF-4]|uniref:Purine nucleoside phosphorylase DeoD-type n=1 Tax=Metalysinibacillus saudimassiliensis TaxID=1461583 RepID=A0A078MIY2_9BACL|nr:purine-nucleoside phosphorylase [Lysinibacillus sp. BF-4]KFL42450.1 purine nucleoside phosphorylase DeoD-type [Lysinibacillus sp. BF-4]CEA05382.1 Purine nucleoside phosphorylase DeoD-type [Metalysinibacillus saudimassiliensis]
MSVHIKAQKGEIADTILLPGDPLRAKYIAETFLEDVVQYNDVRNMFGYTGTYKGKRISVQGTGMGVPSISIYVTELMAEYDVQKLIRVGTCGAIQKDVKVRDVIIAQSATTDSNINNIIFNNINFAPTADFDLLHKAYMASKEAGLNVRVGNVFTADMFYSEENQNEKLARYGVLGVEMEAAALYTIAAKYGRQALAVLTVSDHILTGEITTPEERQTTFNDMIIVALEAAIQE